MNLQYLNTLPSVEIGTFIELEENEYVVFAAKLGCFGDQNDQMLGKDAPMLMTNKRIAMYNGAGIWTVDLENDIVSLKKVQSGFWIFKSEYFEIVLKENISYESGSKELSGYHLYFYDEGIKAQFGKIVEGVFGEK